MSFTAKEALEKILKGENIRESIQEMELPVKEEEDLEGLMDLEDEYADFEEVDMTDEEFDTILSDIEFESEEVITQEEWDKISTVLEKKVRMVKDGKVVVVDVKKKKKKKLSSKQKAALKKARKASRKPGAAKARAKSMKKRKSAGL